ncbi:MAG: protein-disulfide reductase DsbD domain-containing protein [Pseudolabrys sp.]
MSDFRMILAAACCATVLAVPAAHAADASDWSEDTRSAVRLIAGTNNYGQVLRAGLEIKLTPGWKTYWRYPGDSGVPPKFDFAGSENVATARVFYPAPALHSDDTGQTLVYEKGVVFPLRVVPKEPGKPVRLRVKIDYAVCEKLCVPAEGRADLPLGPGASGEDAKLKAAEARVPSPATAAEAGLVLRRIAGGTKPQVTVDVAAPGDAPVQVFVEGPTADWALPIPKPVQGAPAGHRQFTFELDGLPPGIDPKSRFDLRVTVLKGTRAQEVVAHLD